MAARWMTLHDIAIERHITLTEAQALIDGPHCPKVFRLAVTLYLV